MFKYFYTSKPLLIFNCILTILNSILCVLFAQVLKALIDLSTQSSIEKLYEYMAFTFFYLVFMMIVGYSLKYVRIYYNKKIMVKLKNDIFSKIINKSVNSFVKENSANFISTLSNDIGMLESDYFYNILFIFENILLFTFATIYLGILNINIAVGVILVEIITLTIPQLFANKLSKYKKEFSDSIALFTVKLKDLLSGFEIIRSFGIEDKANYEFSKVNNHTESKKFRYYVFSGLVDSFSSIFGSLIFLVTIGIGTYLVIIGKTSVGIIIAAIQLINNISGPLIQISYRINRLKSVSSIIIKLKAIDSTNINNDELILKLDFNDCIEFKNVSFSYDGKRNAVKDLNFIIKKGEKIVILGHSGCGKSTVLKLMLNYFEVYQGDILIDGINIKEINTNCFCKLISLIQQNVFLFDDSIKENIKLYNNFNKDEFNRAIKLAGLSEFLNKDINMEISAIGEDGKYLSGGEKQRISIARAVIKNTPILLMDEATSSLDVENSYRIEKALSDNINMTSINITHRIHKDLIIRYNNILVLEEGEIVEQGNFEQLMNKRGYFYHVYYRNFDRDIIKQDS